MQKSILPTAIPEASDDYEVFAHMEPARNVGGDFYDVINLEHDRIGLCIADVSDKGVPAALFLMSSRTLLKGASIGCDNPGDVLREVNDLLRETNDTEMFVTLLYGIYDPATGDFTYANGGHNEPLLIRTGWKLVAAPAHGRHHPRGHGRHGVRPQHRQRRAG